MHIQASMQNVIQIQVALIEQQRADQGSLRTLRGYIPYHANCYVEAVLIVLNLPSFVGLT